MKFDALVSRPVLAVVINLAIVLAGLVAYQRLSVRQIPNIDPPVVNVSTTYPGASPRIIETQLTKPIEDAIAGVDGVDFVQSISRSESSQVTVYFDLDKSPEVAAADVRDRVSRVRASLPAEALDPVVQKQEADADAIIYVALLSDRHSQLELADIAQRFVKDRLQAIPGVAEAKIYGNRYAMRVWLDPARLAGARLTPEDVEAALRFQNIEVPAGSIEGSDREFTAFAQTRYDSAEAFANMVVKEANGYLVRLGDVADVELGGDRARFEARYNGKGAVPIGIIRLASANPLDIAKHLRESLPEIEKNLPAGMKAEVAYDTTVFIKRSVENVIRTIAEALVLVALVILLVLRSWRASLIPIATIPISLIGTFAFMLACGFSINTLSLLAMVLAIGLVVDDAIVVLENVHRHLENGMSALDAARRSIRETGTAVIAMTLTLAAVYVPLALSGGRTGKLFTEFALTLAFTVVLSGVVALTLTPVMCARLSHAQVRGSGSRTRLLDRLIAAYGHLLERTLQNRRVVVAVAAIVAIAGVMLFKALPAEIAPQEDQGMVIQVATAPEGSTLTYTNRHSRKLESILESVPEGNRVFELVGINGITSAVGFVGLKDWSERTRSAQDIAAGLLPQFLGVSGLDAFPVTPPPLGQGGVGQPVSFVVQTSGSWEQLDKAVSKMLALMRRSPGFVAVDSNLKLNKPELRLEIDNDKVSSVGSTYLAVARSIETMLGGRQVTRFNKGAEQYDVIVQVADKSRTTPSDIGQIHIRTKDGEMMPISNVLKTTEGVAAKQLSHFNKLRSATITAGLAPGFSQGEALEWIAAAARQEVPDVQVELTGQAREFRRSASDFTLIAILAVLVIYLVLAAQFESFVDPMIILVSVPLAVTGALALLVTLNVGAGADLWNVKGSWNIYSQIGMVTLVGLVAKHGILIVEFSNRLRATGIDRAAAALQASMQRLRPILMTTAAMVLGAIPLALASGAGAEARHQIGWVIVGGMVVGTVLTLFIVPVAYALLGARAERGRDVVSSL